jgi:hypothetical protein
MPATYLHNDGRRVYFDDPDGHLLEVMTRPYKLAPKGLAPQGAQTHCSSKVMQIVSSRQPHEAAHQCGLSSGLARRSSRAGDGVCR